MPIYLQHGNMIDYVPPTNMTTDDVVFIGGLVGIPQFPMKSGQAGSLSVDGIYQFDKKEGVAVNLGDVVKYCGTTKLAQDSNADLTLGVAVADAEADDYGVKVKINSVLPTDGGGGGGGGEVAVSCGLAFNNDGELIVKVANGCGIDFNSDGELVATGGGGGGGGEVAVCGDSGLYFDNGGRVAIKYCGNSAINADHNGVYLAVCGDSGLYFQDGELVASGGGGGGDGIQNLSSGYESLSILGQATTSDYSVTIGFSASANNVHAIALGENAIANGNSSVAIGWQALTSLGGANSLAIGSRAQVNGGGASAVGNEVVTAAINSANFGYNTKLYDQSVASIGSYAFYENGLRTQLYVIAEGSPLSQQYLNGKAGLAYAVWGDNEIFTNGKVKEGKIIALKDLFANGIDFVPSTEASGGCCGC